jgi:hypothetical protein
LLVSRMPQYPDLQLFVADEWKSADGAPVINPADESIIGTVPHATRTDLDAALSAAEEGFRVWRQTSPAKRAELLTRAAQLCRERVEEMAVAMTLEQGKPIAQSRLKIRDRHDIDQSPRPRAARGTVRWRQRFGLRLRRSFGGDRGASEYEIRQSSRPLNPEKGRGRTRCGSALLIGQFPVVSTTRNRA